MGYLHSEFPYPHKIAEAGTRPALYEVDTFVEGELSSVEVAFKAAYDFANLNHYFSGHFFVNSPVSPDLFFEPNDVPNSEVVTNVQLPKNEITLKDFREPPSTFTGYGHSYMEFVMNAQSQLEFYDPVDQALRDEEQADDEMLRGQG